MHCDLYFLDLSNKFLKYTYLIKKKNYVLKHELEVTLPQLVKVIDGIKYEKDKPKVDLKGKSIECKDLGTLCAKVKYELDI